MNCTMLVQHLPTRPDTLMKIKITTLYVNDQQKALDFYTATLGFVKKADFSQGSYRWLTVASAEDPDGIELQLELNNDPAAKAFQEAKYNAQKPALMLYVDDVQAEEDRARKLGATFTMPTTKVTGSTIAMLDDTCGNIVQLVALDKWGA